MACILIHLSAQVLSGVGGAGVLHLDEEIRLPSPEPIRRLSALQKSCQNCALCQSASPHPWCCMLAIFSVSVCTLGAESLASLSPVFILLPLLNFYGDQAFLERS